MRAVGSTMTRSLPVAVGGADTAAIDNYRCARFISCVLSRSRLLAKKNVAPGAGSRPLPASHCLSLMGEQCMYSTQQSYRLLLKPEPAVDDQPRGPTQCNYGQRPGCVVRFSCLLNAVTVSRH